MGKYGIHFQNLRYISTTLTAYVGETVTLRLDPRDMAEIRVFHENRFLCEAVCPELAGATIFFREILHARNQRRRSCARPSDTLGTGLPAWHGGLLHLEAEAKLESIRQRDKEHDARAFLEHDWITDGPIPQLQPTYGEVADEYGRKELQIGDPTTLIMIDEADRLRMASLEQVRAIFDAGKSG